MTPPAFDQRESYSYAVRVSDDELHAWWRPPIEADAGRRLKATFSSDESDQEVMAVILAATHVIRLNTKSDDARSTKLVALAGERAVAIVREPDFSWSLSPIRADESIRWVQSELRLAVSPATQSALPITRASLNDATTAVDAGDVVLAVETLMREGGIGKTRAHASSAGCAGTPMPL